MHQVTLRGSYKEMGHQQGRFLKGLTLHLPDQKMLHLAKQCEEIMAQYAPELLDEMRGLAWGVRASGSWTSRKAVPARRSIERWISDISRR